MKILFVCKGNMFRSQIAESIVSKIIGSENVVSAGTYTGAVDEPEGQILSSINHHSIFIQFMDDLGYKDFGLKKTKRVTRRMVDWADLIIDMSEPEYDLDIVRNSKKTIFWNIENPLFQNYSFEEGYKKTKDIYNQLYLNINKLLV